MTDSFVSGFYYLDTLGSLARAGHSIFLRQGLMGGWYSLLQPTPLNSTEMFVSNFVPLPDYWAGLLFKHTMGEEVLNAGPNNASASGSLRVYAHCAGGEGAKTPGAVTVLIINLSSEELTVDAIGGIQRLSPRLEWHLTPVLPGDPGLQASEVLLNGDPLGLISSGELPSLAPRRAASGRDKTLTIAPTSFVFVTALAANVSACRP